MVHRSPAIAIVFRLALSTALTGALVSAVLVLLSAGAPPANATGATVPPPPPDLFNGSFECSPEGYYEGPLAESRRNLYPNGWGYTYTEDTAANGYRLPKVYSNRINFEKIADPANGGCLTNNAFVEKLHGRDSLLIEARSLETPPFPGKRFDISLYQTFTTAPGVVYSVSGWVVSLCGGSANPNDCPAGNYIAKWIGLDPAGDSDPVAPGIAWYEDRRPHIEAKWTNLRTAATATGSRMTVFLRVQSPFQWHGNHAFADAVKVVEAPTATLQASTPITGQQSVTLTWDGRISQQILNISGGRYHLYFDVEVRHAGQSDWRSLVTNFAGAGSLPFTARCTNSAYFFRVRPRAEQFEGQGAAPNHRFPGVWSEPVPVNFVSEPGQPATDPGVERTFLPLITVTTDC